MKIYTYGIIDSNNKIDESIDGLENMRICNIPYRNIGAVSSDLNIQIEDINKNHILKHEEVVERLMGNFTILPFKFFTVFNKKEDVLSMVKTYYGDFRKNLDRLHNKVEFGIKIIWSGDTIKKHINSTYNGGNANAAISDNSPGRNFVWKKFKNYKTNKELEKEANRCIAFIDEHFKKIAVEKKLQKLQSKNLLLNASYLVDRGKQSYFESAFERLRNAPRSQKFKYLFSGPWPPYNFIILTKKAS